jgi:iron complex outermembrane receptor protein
MWYCLLGVGLSLTHALSALAQTRSPEPVAENQIPSEVIVTGSRLHDAATEAAAPVIVLTRSDLERSGASSLGDVLQALPVSTGSSLNTNVDAGLGATRINLRGLGSERTLVLLNGRRLPNGGVGGDNSVDINALPDTMIDHVEVLASGASAVHGSDAVGGVVNLITRRPGDASSMAASCRVTGKGDGQVLRAGGALGFDLAHSNWSLGIDYVQQRGVKNDQRAYSARPLRFIDGEGTIGYAGQNGIPDGQFVVPPGNLLGLAPGRYLRVAGASGQSAAAYRPFTRADSFSVSPFNYSQTPNERTAVWLFGRMSLTSDTSMFVEGLIHRRESSQAAAPEQFLPLSDPTPTLADGSSGIPAQNFYNPFGVDLPFAARRFVEGRPRVTTETIKMWRLVAGIEGDAAGWHWELATGIARSDSTTRSDGAFALSRYVNALGPSGPDDSGKIVCGKPDQITGRVPSANVIPGCVPLDIFNGAGSITQKQLDYMSPRSIVDVGTNEQRFADAVLTGRWGRVLGGELRWAIGTEYRREAGSFIGDPLRALDYQGLSDPALPGGAFDTKEVFVEMQVPILRDRSDGRTASVNAGVRWSDFSSFGHDISWDTGLRWQLTRETTLRANYGTVFRAPSIQELFGSRTIDTASAIDPCGNRPGAVQRAHCAANGVAGGTYVQNGTEFGVINGGNPELGPETGQTIGFGVIYAPAWVHDLSATLDWFDITLSGVIDSQDPEALLFECAQYGTEAACESIRRAPDGHVSLVAAVNRNFARRSVRGIDSSINWHGSSPGGELRAGLMATYLERWDERLYSGGETLHQAGRLDAGALPRWRASAHFDWHRGHWYASYAAELIGSMTERVKDFPPLGIVFAPYPRRVPSAVFHDIEIRYKIRNSLALQAAVTNVTDKAPPFINTGLPENTEPGTYRLLGRTFFLGLRHAF